MKSPSIYFDYNATTPLDSGARETMIPFLGEVYGNPSSIHHVGRAARAALDEARDRVATVWACKPSEVIFTSGGTESNNLAIFGAARARREKGRHLITSSIEHPAVLHACHYLEKEGFAVTYLPVGPQGIVDPESVRKALRPETILVSVMAANNETGALQPVAEIGRICREKEILFHTDAVQWFGKEPFGTIQQFNADLVSICAHKIHGPKGAGALFVRSPFFPDPILFGGAHENERRAGTENLSAIMGLAHVVERFLTPPVFQTEILSTLTGKLRLLLESLGGVQFQSPDTRRLANTVSFTVSGTDSIALLAGLDLEGICASSGSACASGSLEPSHVLEAMGVPQALANSLVRFSLGRESTQEEVDYVSAILPRIIDRARKS